MSYDILKNLGLDHLDAKSPEFLKALDDMQREAFRSLNARADPRLDADDVETIVG